MAQFKSDYPTQSPTDEYGNPIHQTGGVHDLTGTGTGYGSKDTGTGFKGEATGQGVTTLPRSGSSSSSSEDDGCGGRRKKGVTEKIKEKLPGGRKTDDPYNTAHQTTGTQGYGGAGEHQEKKGMMDKIKEKVPGGQK